jgi:hypothetical protein
MKTFNKTLIAASVTAMAMGSGMANAEWTAGSVPIVVIAQGVATAKAAVPTTSDPIYTLATGESLTINDTIKLDLTGGAVFSANTPTLTCDTGNLGGGANLPASPLSGGTAGTTSAIWRATDALCAPPAILTYNSNAVASTDVTGVGSTGNVDLLITLTTSTGIPIGTPSQSLNTALEGVPGNGDAYLFSGSALVATTAVATSNDTAQVTTAYKLFPGVAPANVNTTASTITQGNNATGTSIPTNPIAAANLLYTLTGDFTGVTAVTALGVTGSNGLGVATAPADPNELTIDAGAGKAWATNTGAIVPGDTLAIADFHITIDGTTSQTARSFALGTAILGDATWSAHTSRTSAVQITISRNGTFFTTNSTGPLNDIKITDTSGSATASGGEINIIAYNAAGVAVPQAPSAPALPASVGSNATVIISGADLLANYPLAVRLDFTINTVSAAVSNVKKTASGTTVSVFTNTTGSGVL